MTFILDTKGRISTERKPVAEFAYDTAAEERWIKNAIRFCQGMSNDEMESLIRASRRAEAKAGNLTARP